jgi:hypothetical protein
MLRSRKLCLMLAAFLALALLSGCAGLSKAPATEADTPVSTVMVQADAVSRPPRPPARTGNAR